MKKFRDKISINLTPRGYLIQEGNKLIASNRLLKSVAINSRKDELKYIQYFLKKAIKDIRHIRTGQADKPMISVSIKDHRSLWTKILDMIPFTKRRYQRRAEKNIADHNIGQEEKKTLNAKRLKKPTRLK